eukprot:9017610-Prorocentrum_lima.AAC.1
MALQGFHCNQTWCSMAVSSKASIAVKEAILRVHQRFNTAYVGFLRTSNRDIPRAANDSSV